ncbi:MAG: hypothetical protein ACLU6O_05535 [Bilophila wadsworthia]
MSARFDAAWEQGIRKFSVVIPEELRTHVPTRAPEALPFSTSISAGFEIAAASRRDEEDGM